jgi:hypothetical protein
METEQIKREILKTAAAGLPTIPRQGTALIPLIQNMAIGTGAGLKMILSETFYRGNPDGRSIAIATLKNGTPVKQLFQELGAVKSIFLLGEMIRNYCAQFNVSKNMTPEQIESLAADLYLDFKDRPGNSVMLEELAVFFDRAIRGEFYDPKTGKKINSLRPDRQGINRVDSGRLF